jgi:hypothetical protein
MTQEPNSQELAENLRKKIFLALVSAQDQDLEVGQSRKLMVQRFGVSENQVLQIEREGIDNQWPPLE